MLKLINFLLASFLVISVNAQNPLFWGADPSGIIGHDGRVYVFPTNDKTDWDDQKDWHCLSSDDLIHWTDHGVIFNTEMSAWGINNAWAPDITYKNGTYYFYYYFQNGKEPGGVGVATSKTPAGPFKEVYSDIWIKGHDPAIFLDDNGLAYLYVQDHVYELQTDLITLKGNEPVQLDLDYRPQPYEAAYVFKRNDIYYFTIARYWNNLIYYTSDNPLGPFKYQGEIMKKYGGNNHHSIIQYKDKWIIFYHEWAKHPQNISRRRIPAEWLFFNPDGSIQLVEPTKEGISVQDNYTHEAGFNFDGNTIDNIGAYHAIAKGNPVYSKGITGKSIDFDGTDDQVLLPQYITDDFTITFWLKTTQTGATGNNWFNGTGIIDGYRSYAENNFGISLLGNKLAFGIGAPYTTITSTSNVNNGNWAHVAITRNANNGEINLYINGIKENSEIAKTGRIFMRTKLSLGCLHSNKNYFSGNIDMLNIYVKVLTAKDIEKLAKPSNPIKITASSGKNGQIVPSGQQEVFEGFSQKYDFKPAKNFVTDNVTIDGKSLGPIREYLFEQVSKPHEIHVTFKEQQKHSITVEIEGNGTVSPNNNITLYHTESEKLYFRGIDDHVVLDVIVDGESLGIVRNYMFETVVKDHHLKVVFGKPVQNGKIENGFYKLQSYHSNLYVQVANSALVSGANINQWPYTKTKNQQWQITNVINNWYSIINVNSGMAMQIADSAIADANVTQTVYHGGDDQLWRFIETENGHYALQNMLNKKYLEVKGWSKNDGANIQALHHKPQGTLKEFILLPIE